MANFLLKPSLKTAVLEAMYNEVLTGTSNYYYFLGRPQAWDGDVTETPTDSVRQEVRAREDMVFVKKITSADISYTIPRYDWVSGQVFDMYDDRLGTFYEVSGVSIVADGQTLTGSFDSSNISIGMMVSGAGIVEGTRVQDVTAAAVSLDTPASSAITSGTVQFTTVSYSGADALASSKFYVMTSDYNVYKCLNNNQGSPSTVKPYGTSYELLRTTDGYVWKYMYTVPRALVNRFMTNAEIPVTTALRQQYYTRGSLTSSTVMAQGSNYGATDTLVVSGDGYLEANPFRILNTIIVNPGRGYLATPDVIYDDPFTAVDWEPEATYVLGQYVKNADTNTIYEVVGAGKSGTSAPTHTSDEPYPNGTVSLKFAGQTPTVTATLNTNGSISSIVTSSIIGDVFVTTPGYGYNYLNPPTVTITDTQGSPTGSGATAEASLVFAVPSVVDELFRAATPWSINGLVSVGDFVHWNANVYEITKAGWDDNGTWVDTEQGYLSSTAPYHNSGVVESGTGTEAVPTTYLTYRGNASQSSRVGRIILTSRGSGYVAGAVNCSVSAPFVADIVWAANTNIIVQENQIIGVGDKFYRAVNAGTLPAAEDGPSHTGGIVVVGDVEMEFIGQTAAVGNPEIYYGYGYSSVPQISVVDSGSQFVVDQATAWQEGGLIVSVDEIIKTADNHMYKVIEFRKYETWESEKVVQDNIIMESGGHYYQISGSGALGTSAPTHTSGLAVNGSVTLVYVGDTPFTDFVPSINELLIDTETTSGPLGEAAPSFTSGEAFDNNNMVLQYIGETTGAIIEAEIGTVGTKTSAVLTPVIVNRQIVAVIAQDPGIGYTTASITPQSSSGIGALIVPNLSYGDLNTRQANIELLATPGTIDSLIITNAGSNISSCSLSIKGDGSNAVVLPSEIVLTNGRLTKVSITRQGSNYTWADVEVTVNEGATPPVVRAVVSPFYGHGHDSVRELYASSMSISTSVSIEKNQGFIVNNDYHQVGLLKNPSRYNSTQRFNGGTGSPCFVATTTSLDPAYIEKDGILYDQAGSGNAFRIVDFSLNVDNSTDPATTTTTLLLQSLGGTGLVVPQPLWYYNSSTEVWIPAPISGITEPSLNKYSGDLLFIDNKGSFQPTDAQTVSIKTAIKL